jgi:hypothetical protein
MVLPLGMRDRDDEGADHMVYTSKGTEQGTFQKVALRMSFKCGPPRMQI